MFLRVPGKNTSDSARRICVLGFLFLLIHISCKTPKPVESGITSPPMTVMNITMEEEEGAMVWKVVFKESQRFYLLPADAPEQYHILLDGSQKNRTPVIITRKDDASRIITAVKKAE